MIDLLSEDGRPHGAATPEELLGGIVPHWVDAAALGLRSPSGALRSVAVAPGDSRLIDALSPRTFELVEACGHPVRFDDDVELDGVRLRALVAAPVEREGRLSGCLVVGRIGRGRSAFGRADVELAGLLAKEVGALAKDPAMTPPPVWPELKAATVTRVDVRLVPSAVDRLLRHGHAVFVASLGSDDPRLGAAVDEVAEALLGPADLLGHGPGGVVVAVSDAGRDRGELRFDRFIDHVAQRVRFTIGYAEALPGAGGRDVVARATAARSRKG